MPGLPSIPHSFRELIEKSVTNKRTYRRLLESPLAMLRSYGAETDTLSEEDVDRLVVLVTRMRKSIEDKKSQEDLTFEDIFGAAAEPTSSGFRVNERAQVSRSESFTPNTERSQSSYKESTVNLEWSGVAGQSRGFGAPLIDREAMSKIVAEMEKKVGDR